MARRKLVSASTQSQFPQVLRPANLKCASGSVSSNSRARRRAAHSFGFQYEFLKVLMHGGFVQVCLPETKTGSCVDPFLHHGSEAVVEAATQANAAEEEGVADGEVAEDAFEEVDGEQDLGEDDSVAI